MLVTTVTAMATDYVADCVVSCNNQESTMSGATISVVDNGDGTYNITLKALKSTALGMDFGDLTLSNLSGTTEGGVTTISVAEVNAKFTSGDYMEAPESPIKSFVCKFNAEKLYANYGSGSMLRLNNWQRTAFTASFGTDEGFESTGGGETGGEDKPAIVTVKENFQSTEGSSWGENVTIDWNTQKLVASINLASTGSDKGFLGVTKKGQTAGWNNYGIIFYNTNGSTVQGYAPGQPNNANTDQVTKGEDPVRFEISKDGGVKCQGNVVISASNIAHLTNQSEIVVGAADKPAGALYNYIKVVPLDWKETTEPTEPEVTVTFEKQYADKLYSLADGTPSAMGDATVTLKEMSDNTISMSLAFTGMNVESTDLVKGTDEKDRITYTGTANFQGTNFAVKALRYTKDEEEKLYMTLTPTDGTTLAFGEDPDYVAPAEPEDVTLWENYQADGNGFSKTATINWDKQKIVASIDFSNGGDDKDILAMTAGDSFAAFQTSTYRTMHWYCQQSVKQMSGFFAKSGSGNNNTGRFDVADCIAKFEISKAEGLKVNGEVKMAPYVLDELFASNTILIGSGESPKFSKAFYKYIKVVSLDWTEKTEPEVKEEKTFNEALYMVQGTTSTKVADAKVVVKEMSDETINMSLQFNGNEYTSTELVKGTDTKGRTTYTGKVSKDTQTFDVAGVVYEKDNAERLYMTMTATGVTFVVGENPDAVTPEAVAYKNELTIVRGANHKVYNDAEVTVLAKGEGKYEVTLPEFSDMDLVNAGTVGKIVFEANGEEVDGVLQLTAENAAGVISTGEAWSNYAADVTMSGEVENNQLAAKFTVVLGGMSDYTYELGFGKEIFIPTTETITDWANVKFGDSDPVNIENAKLDITMVSASTAKLTFKDVMINGNNIGDFAISGVKATFNTDDYTTVLTTEATKGTWVRATENNALGVIVGAESDIRNFEGTQDEDAGKTVVKFGVFFGSAYGWADIVFGEKAETPDQPKDDYAVNFDKDANSTHSSRALNSFSLQQTGKDKQTKSVKTSKAAYEDHTADEPFTVEAGSELTASFDYTGEWMHSFVYIDFDNDGKFSYKEGQWDQTGTDLVAFSFYSLDSNPKNDASGYNSVGDELTGDARNTYAAPSFKAPAKAGEYRIRFKIDWNCILPGGSSSILSDGGGVWDATLKVVEPVVDGISTINAEIANGEAQLFTVDGVQIAKLQKGLNIVRSADGKVKKVLVK